MPPPGPHPDWLVGFNSDNTFDEKGRKIGILESTADLQAEFM